MIILLTDDYTFSDKWINKYSDKIILINHFYINRRLYTKYNILVDNIINYNNNNNS